LEQPWANKGSVIVRRKGGLTEFIPSPRQKREGLIRDRVLELHTSLIAGSIKDNR
jgi:hypothetical protein